MKIFAILIVISTALSAEINKLFFSGPNIYIDCPGDGLFYQWKKYYSGQVTNLLSDDKRRLNVPLKAELSPTTYQCSGTNGFINYNENITIFVLDKESTDARKLCYIRKAATAEYPCFLYYQKEPLIRVGGESTVALNCEAGGINVTYIWYKLNTPNSHQELMTNYANIPVLKINSIDQISSGQYLCVVNTTSGDNLKRFFDIQIFENSSSNTNTIFIDGPNLTNVIVKLNKNHRLTCQAEAIEPHSIHLIQWAKRLDPKIAMPDRNLVIEWGNSQYKLIPESQVQNSRESGSSVTTSLLLNSVTSNNAGQYICAFFTNVGKMKHKTFSLVIEQGSSNNGAERSFLSLYILIPSLIIAVCLFVGIYLTINRMSVRKAAHSGTGAGTSNCCKPSDTEAIHLRSTPENSINSYPTKGPPLTQYTSHSNYPSPYYTVSDKLIL